MDCIDCGKTDYPCKFFDGPRCVDCHIKKKELK